MDLPSLVLPTELWQIVCHSLKSNDLLQLRLVNKNLAAVAGEVLIRHVRFDTSQESLARLEAIATHDALKKGVKTLTCECGLLEQRCIHHYTQHYESQSHLGVDKPIKPSTDQKSERALRLYLRNLEKFEKLIKERYKTLCTKYDAQQHAIRSAKDVLARMEFPNLEEISLVTNAHLGYPHSCSVGFCRRYLQDCAATIDDDSAPTVWQLTKLLQSSELKSLSASEISPLFFNGEDGRDAVWLASKFKSLETIMLTLKPDEATITSDVHGSGNIGSATIQSAKLLSHALASAMGLKSLTINFSHVVQRIAGSLLGMLGHTSFPELKQLDLDMFETTGKDLVQTLKRQPKLVDFTIAYCVLTQGHWAEVIKSLRWELSLKSFGCFGLLEETDTIIPTEWCERESWLDGERYTLSFALEMYVIDKECPVTEEDWSRDEPGLDFDLMWNPIHRMDEDFADEEELMDEYGPVDELKEIDSDDNDDTDNTDEDDTDISDREPDDDGEMPDLMDLDT